MPFDGGTAIQEDPDRPAFRGNGPDDYVCVQCGNVLAEAMHAVQMTKKVRVRCGRCSTVNVAVTDESQEPARDGTGHRAARPSSAARWRS